MRLLTDPNSQQYAQWLKKLSYDSRMHGRVSLPSYIRQTDSIEQFCNQFYPLSTLQSARQHPEVFKDKAIVAFRNDSVAAFNKMILQNFPGDMHTLYGSNEADVPDSAESRSDLPAEYLQSLDIAGLPPSKLCLKVRAPVILLRNLYPQRGLCNGTRMTVTHVGRRCIQVRILGGEFDGNLETLSRIRLTSTEQDLPFILTRKQFPIRLCFAMTVNKSQGQSLREVGLDLRTPAFTHGQLYVALSRVTNVAGISALFAEGREWKTDNIVYLEVLIGDG